MTGSAAPLALARAAVEVAVRPLPQLDDRLRYRAEFTADLTVLRPLGQLRYAVGVLSQTFALRAALGSSPTRSEEAVMTVATRKPFFIRCSVFRAHYWVVRSTEDGDRYRACKRCGRMAPPVNTIGTAGIGGVF